MHGHGVGRSKKEAEQQAAESAYRTLVDELTASESEASEEAGASATGA
jgi:ribonuclease-3